MNPQARELFVQALEMEPAARDAFIAQACVDDASLHLEVQRILVNAGRADSFFADAYDITVGAEEFQETCAEKEGDTVGPFKLRQPIRPVCQPLVSENLAQLSTPFHRRTR